MIVNRTADTSGPATLTIYLRQKQGSSSTTPSPVTPDTQPSSSSSGLSKAPEPTPVESTIKIDMKGLHSDAILQNFLAKSGAVAVSPAPQEEAEMRDIEERAERAKVDREVMARYIFTKRKEATILAQAKSEAAALKQAL
jgi:large subunit ribosomal protein MRP49